MHHAHLTKLPGRSHMRCSTWSHSSCISSVTWHTNVHTTPTHVSYHTDTHRHTQLHENHMYHHHQPHTRMRNPHIITPTHLLLRFQRHQAQSIRQRPRVRTVECHVTHMMQPLACSSKRCACVRCSAMHGDDQYPAKPLQSNAAHLSFCLRKHTVPAGHCACRGRVNYAGAATDSRRGRLDDADAAVGAVGLAGGGGG